MCQIIYIIYNIYFNFTSYYNILFNVFIVTFLRLYASGSVRPSLNFV